MDRGFSLFLARLLSNTNKDLFMVRLGVTLLLNKFNIVGFIAGPVGYILRSVIGLLMEYGIFQIDLALDAYKEGQKLAEFKDAATQAYEKATKKLYTEAEKDAIRKEYLAIISKFGSVGNPS